MTAGVLGWAGTPPEEAARALGFARGSDGAWVRGGLVLETGPGWLAARRAEPCCDDPLRDVLGRRGLWRVLPSRTDAARNEWVFDLPALAPRPADDVGPAEAAHPAAPLVDWAERLERGDPVEPPPERGGLEAWIATADCAVRAGDTLAQVEPVLGDARLGLAIPELVRVPAALAPARAAWLAELCRAAQVHWHLVRLGIDGERLRAEVDVSGAPAALCRPLLELALVALRHSAQWVLPALELITDPSASSEVADRHPRWATPRPQGGPA